MEHIIRTDNGVAFSNILESTRLNKEKYTCHKMFIRRKSWGDQLYWEVKEASYKPCKINDNCDLNYIGTKTITNISISDLLAKDWEMWIEVLY